MHRRDFIKMTTSALALGAVGGQSGIASGVAPQGLWVKP
ncbi:twin-arginine translocation signal domain-containing protein [Microbulbifer taiwanensis]